MTAGTILLCTVGGSHRPILKAIRETSPDFVCFFCTGQDPATGKAGSMRQVRGKGNVIKARREDSKPTLPNIPAQAGLEAERFTAVEVPADDLDGCFIAMHSAIRGLSARVQAGARVVADYTGGTKTMSAALVHAALESDGINLQLIAGARSGLGQVLPATAFAAHASVNHLRLARAMAPLLDGWRRFAYREAAEGLQRIQLPGNTQNTAPRLLLAHALSDGLALWDDFDHEAALARLEPFAARFASDFPKLLRDVRLLSRRDDTRNEPALLFDLWWNACRRAAQGRYDDAVGRWYRLIEWTAQWQLRTRLRADADTGDFPPDLVPPGMEVAPDRDGRIKLGLSKSWEVIERGPPGQPNPAQAFWTTHKARLRDLLTKRNQSILAHGFRSVTASDWGEVHSFTRDCFLPALRELARDAGLKNPPGQLPDEPPKSLLGLE